MKRGDRGAGQRSVRPDFSAIAARLARDLQIDREGAAVTAAAEAALTTAIVAVWERATGALAAPSK